MFNNFKLVPGRVDFKSSCWSKNMSFWSLLQHLLFLSPGLKTIINALLHSVKQLAEVKIIFSPITIIIIITTIIIIIIVTSHGSSCIITDEIQWSFVNNHTQASIRNSYSQWLYTVWSMIIHRSWPSQFSALWSLPCLHCRSFIMILMIILIILMIIWCFHLLSKGVHGPVEE